MFLAHNAPVYLQPYDLPSVNLPAVQLHVAVVAQGYYRLWHVYLPAEQVVSITAVPDNPQQVQVSLAGPPIPPQRFPSGLCPPRHRNIALRLIIALRCIP